MSRFGRSILVVAAALLAMSSLSVERAYPQQKGSGVAGTGHVAGGGAGGTNTGSRAASRGDAASTASEATPRLTARRIREIESLEQQCLSEVNRIRRNRKLPPLEIYSELLPVAREYSRRMSEEHFFSHTDPAGHTVRERVEEADIKWRMVGENLAYSNGYTNPVAASLRGWMESPGHRRNILDPDYQLTAVGAWIAPDGTVYFTEIFLKQ